MATVTTTASVGSKNQSGKRQHKLNEGSSDVTLSYDDTKIMSKGDLRDVLNSMIDSIGSLK